MKKLLLIFIRAYQLVLSPWMGHHCRHYPSCSAYATEAIQVHGAFRGTVLAVKRLSRCHPWHPGGADPVPQPEELAPAELAPIEQSPTSFRNQH